MPISEIQLQKKVADALDKDGYVVETEVEIGRYSCDILIREYKHAEFNSQDLPIALEIKSTNGDIRKGIGQCLAYEVLSKGEINSQLCIPSEKVNNFTKQMAKNAGVGLVQIGGLVDPGDEYIKPVYDPVRNIFLR